MWRFRDLKPGEPERNPHEAEFFRLTNVTEAIVREFIQNSLDAKRVDVQTVRVRFVLGEGSRRWLDQYVTVEFKRHLSKCKLFPPEYDRLTHIPFLTIEDFGTTGLDGDTGERRRPEGRHNFYNFWWWEGKSSKSGKEAGRWGLGKTTFHMASRLRAFWGLTVRFDDHRKLLMGKALMESHSLDGVTYDYSAYYVADGHRPIESGDKIAEFSRMFSITRNHEPGLSVVIPMPADEIETAAILRSAIYNYFYAIMTGLLQIEIVDSLGTNRLSSSNLIELAIEEDWQGTEWEDTNVGVFLNFVRRCIEKTERIELPLSCADRLAIDEDAFGETLNGLREGFLDNRLISIRVPVRVRKADGDVKDSHFDIYIQRDATLKKAQEYYVRSGITLVNVRSLKNRQVRALFLAQDPVITEFLGDAETPAHTEWNEKTEGFKNKYVNAVSVLRFIKKSMETIVTLLDLPPKERQTELLKDVFYVIDSVKRERKKDTTIDDPPSGIERHPPVFTVTKLENGLRVTLAKEDSELPLTGVLELAYGVRRGNPFKQHETNDFNLVGGSIPITASGCSVTRTESNVVEFEVVDKNFSLELRGFDTKRDLVVSVKEKK